MGVGDGVDRGSVVTIVVVGNVGCAVGAFG